MSQAQDLEAINHYMRTVSANTSEAAGIRSAWPPWYDGLSWWDINIDSGILQQARARRDTFNIQNAVTEKQAEQVQAVIEHSADKEQIDLSKVLGKSSKEISANFPPPVAHPTIRKGDGSKTRKAAAVADWQNVLTLETNGEFDSRTDAATRAFQKAHRLTVDGVVGPKTWAMGYSAASATTGAPPPAAVVDSTKKYPPARPPLIKSSSGRGTMPVVNAPAEGRTLSPVAAAEAVAQAKPVHKLNTAAILGTGAAGAAAGALVGGPPGALIGGIIGGVGAAIGSKLA